MRASLTGMFLLGLVFILGSPVWAENELLLRAVGLALTGTHDAHLKLIGAPASCVFAIGNETFRLNNVYKDRIQIREWQKQSFAKRQQGVSVELEGGDVVVFEITIEPPKDDGSELMQHMRAESPEMFNPHHYIYTRQELYLQTIDQDEVKRAWQYIYSHGCAGKRSS